MLAYEVLNYVRTSTSPVLQAVTEESERIPFQRLPHQLARTSAAMVCAIAAGGRSAALLY